MYPCIVSTGLYHNCTLMVEIALAYLPQISTGPVMNFRSLVVKHRKKPISICHLGWKTPDSNSKERCHLGMKLLRNLVQLTLAKAHGRLV